MITKNFIKMCEKAEDIQKAWKPAIGDYSFNDEIFIISKIQLDITTKMYRLDNVNNFSSLFEMENILQDNFIWLPTQEQLQGMVKSVNVIDLFMGLYRFVWGLNKLGEDISLEARQYPCQFNSMQELYFAFVMKEHWNKVWNGEDWIKIDKVI